MDDVGQERLDQMIDYIMKNCLWQFNSRAWDRAKQNEGILTKTTQLLCNETPDKEAPLDKCYWVDAVCLAEAYRSRFPWLLSAKPEEIRSIMGKLREKIDYLTITGSLNEELTVQHY